MIVLTDNEKCEERGRMKNEILKYSLVICGLLGAGNVLAQDSSLANLSDQQRILRLERMLNSDVLESPI